MMAGVKITTFVSGIVWLINSKHSSISIIRCCETADKVVMEFLSVLSDK